MKTQLLNDMHTHLRQGQMLKDIIPYHVERSNYILVMPNTIPPILTKDDVIAYRKEIEANNLKQMKILMTAALTEQTTPEMIKELKDHIIAMKLYPIGVTTNSSQGITKATLDVPYLNKNFMACLRQMEKQETILSIHGEMPGEFCLDREHKIIPFIYTIHLHFPNLKIVVEHITTARMLDFVNSQSNMAGTITLHHLLITLDDVIGSSINVNNFCKPIAKTYEDIVALRTAAVYNNKFFFGSDSAPHLKINKECSEGCAGCFTAPITLELLIELFEQFNSINHLSQFTTYRAASFYNLPNDSPEVELEEDSWIVPNNVYNIVPFWASKEIKYRIKRG